ncbi:hypothetical protein [Epibacterium ulvae]|nr:hypothetical protein [Epibacterium ulvae]
MSKIIEQLEDALGIAISGTVAEAKEAISKIEGQHEDGPVGQP